MASQEKRMCTVDEYNHGLYDDDDYLGGLIYSILDFPVESFDGDDLRKDWASELGPIPSEVFPEMLPPSRHGGGGGGGGGGGADFLDCGGHNVGTYEAEFQPFIHKEVFKSQLKPQQPPTFSQEKKPCRVPKSFEAPSPDSVLERRTSSSAQKTVSFGTEIAIPVRTRTKRSRSRLPSGLTANSWSKSLQQFPFQKVKKKRRKLVQHDVNEVKKCSHCEITKTPQWREGPMGPKTLCNACGVRYRSGRLFPEYRPAASPTFVPSLHSNSHRRVVEMRNKGAAMDDDYVVKKHLSSNVEIQHSRLCS
ncbi:hypothetical protein L1987_00538 [Smallanthus sonchifolius]|uniref:Uncharacterized protein n=1 Tax=Smallanthus sonchifolius TaxID=185202 RepID=A0ACB9K2S1_9ASTR|nr:hypothetical protein L1987_00538 [Smallanthus sonchifolius]